MRRTSSTLDNLEIGLTLWLNGTSYKVDDGTVGRREDHLL